NPNYCRLVIRWISWRIRFAACGRRCRFTCDENGIASVIGNAVRRSEYFEQTCRSHFVKNDGMSDSADYRDWVAALLLDHDRDLRMHYQSVDLQQFLDSLAQLKRRAPGDRKALGNQGQRDESGRIHANVTGKIGHIENVDVYHVSRAEGNLSHRRARR